MHVTMSDFDEPVTVNRYSFTELAGKPALWVSLRIYEDRGPCVSLHLRSVESLDNLIRECVAAKAEMTATEDLDALRMDGDDMLTPKDPPDPLAPEWDDVAELEEAASETWDAAERKRRAALMADGLTEF